MIIPRALAPSALILAVVLSLAGPATAQETPRTGGVLKSTKEYEWMHNTAVVAKQQMEEVGFVVDLQVVDWATLVQRRTKPELFDVFSTGFTFNPGPALASSLQCNWPGWWCHEEKDRSGSGLVVPPGRGPLTRQCRAPEHHPWADCSRSSRSGRQSRMAGEVTVAVLSR
jgi:hypothetical protein